MTITLPLPDKRLSPNARGHWRVKAKATKSARQLARLLAGKDINSYDWWTDPAKIRSYSLAFFWPDARRRDDDNAAASCKAYRDGIADALGIDDHKLIMATTPSFSIDRQNPRVEITLI